MLKPLISEEVSSVATSLMRIIKEAKWDQDAFVVAKSDEFFPKKPVETKFEVKGRCAKDKALALRAWMPDKLRDACMDVGDENGVDVSFSADFDVEVSRVKARHLLKPDVSSQLVELGYRNMVMCWTSFHEQTDSALKSIVDSISSGRIGKDVRVVSLALDEEPYAARSKARKSGLDGPTHCLWAGDQGWSSKAAKALGIEESAPTFYLFDETGRYLASGDLDDVLSASNEAADADVELDDKCIQLVSEERWKQARMDCIRLNTEGRGRLFLILRTISVWQENPEPSNRQRLIVGGEYFSDSADEVQRCFPHRDALNFTGFEVQRPRPFAISTACYVDEAHAPVEFHCFVCDKSMCSTCGIGHRSTQANHPLLLIGRRGGDLSRSLFGPGMLEFENEGESAQSQGNHVDLGCDACLSALAPNGIRYKNLGRDEHELCEKCFSESLSFKGNAETFQEKFSCHPKDPFCSIKSSKGIGFNRLVPHIAPVQSSQPASPSRPLHHPSPHIIISQLSALPPGHTHFTWYGTLDSGDLPNGHTAFSWGIHDNV